MRRMELLAQPKPHNKYGQYGRSQSEYNIADTSKMAAWDRSTHGVNKKLMRLAVDSKRQSRQSLMYDELPRSRSSTVYLRDETTGGGSLQNLKITQFHDCDNARFPRMEVMSHFHYNSVELEEPVHLLLCGDENDDTLESDASQTLLVKITSKEKSWILKRSVEDFIGLDRQIHRCIYDRRYSLLPQLRDLDADDGLSVDMVNRLHEYLSRFSKLVGNNVNCGPILNWLELDNHGNHLVVMEADDSAINVPAIAAGRVIKRYQAQATDEITLDVGEFLSIIDMPPVEETIWWRGKKGFEVGFFPSHCIEILGVKDVTEKAMNDLTSRPVSKRRGKFISFLRFFFKSRPSKDELMANGILRERVFGCDLGERLALVGREIPLVLEMCSAVIEEYGIVDGIYRLSGILSNLQRLRIAFDSGEEPPDLLDTRYLNDIHCISALLKTYFRELPNPLFTHELYDKFVAAIDKADDTEKTVAFHHVIQRLPPPHYRTMHALLRHLNFCALQAKQTNMTAKNLAIVWAPNLLRPNMDSVSALTEFRTQAIIVEYMIRNVDVFFNSNLASAAIAYYPDTVATPTPSEDTTGRPNSNTTNMGGTKLISLEEARMRLHNRVGIQATPDDAGNGNSPRHKIRSLGEPPQLSAAPISPLPTLLSLEEAQARTKTTTNLAINVRGGGGEGGRELSMDPSVRTNTNNDESPKRNKKWFGLFSKSKTCVEEDGPKAPIYRKKGSGRHNVVISSPTSIPSEEDCRSSSDSDDGARISWRNFDGCEIVPLAQMHDDIELDDVVEDLEVPFQGCDNDDIMSAVVSVSNKYTSMPCRKNEAHKYNHRRSVTIGEPSELRRLDMYYSTCQGTEIIGQPPSEESANKPAVSSMSTHDVTTMLRSTCDTADSLQLAHETMLPPQPTHEPMVPPQLTYETTVRTQSTHETTVTTQSMHETIVTTQSTDKITATHETRDQPLSSHELRPSTRHQMETKREVRKCLAHAFEKIHDEDRGGKSSTVTDERTNVPAKKVRSLSPDNYVDYAPMNIENCDSVALSTDIDSNVYCDENKPTTDTPTISRRRSCELMIDVDAEQTGSLTEVTPAVVFQLVAVPRHESEPTPNEAGTMNDRQSHGLGTCHETYPSTTTALSHPAGNLNTRHEQKPSHFSKSTQMSTFNHDDSENEDGRAERESVKALIEKAKEIDQKYKFRQMSRSADEKQKIESKTKRHDNNTEYNESYIGSKIIPVSSTLARLKAELASSNTTTMNMTERSETEDRCQVTKCSYGEATERKYSRSKSNECVTDTVPSPQTNNHVERSYSLSVKDKVTLFDNPNRAKPKTCSSSFSRNSDSRTSADTEKRRTSMEQGGGVDQIRSTPNLYLHTEHSARASPNSLGDKFKNRNSKETETDKECEKCESNRRSAYSSQARTNSEGSYARYNSNNSNENRQPNCRPQGSSTHSKNSNNNVNRKSNDDINKTNNIINSKNNNNNKNSTYSNNNSCNVSRRKASRETDEKCDVTKGNNETSSNNRKTTKPDRNTTSQTVYRTKDNQSKPPIKPRPLSEAQKHDKQNRGGGGGPVIPNFQQPPFFSLLQKSVSDNYLHTDIGEGKVIGRFPLTLKNGSTIHTHTMFDHQDAMLKKRTSRPLSMYDNVRHSYYDNMTSVRYDLV